MFTKRGLIYKSTSVLLSLILFFVLSACGGKSNNDTAKETLSVNQTDSTASSSTSRNMQDQKSDDHVDRLQDGLEAGLSPVSASMANGHTPALDDVLVA